MKKKIVAIFLVLILCVSVLSFVGCDRRSTLQLLDVWQLTDGRIVLDIKDIDAKTMESVQVSFDNGETWEDTQTIQGDSLLILDEYKYYRGAEVQQSQYGKNCKIAVRLAKDKNKRESKKSNVIEYYIKKPCEYYLESSDASVFEVEYDDGRVDTYLFVYDENDNTILKKYYAEQDGIGEILPVKEQDRLEFEYKIYKGEDITDDAIEYAKKVFGSDTENLEYWSYTISISFDFYGLSFNNAVGFIDFDYQNGIHKDEYGAGIEIEYMDKVERRVYFVIRIKENDTTLCSNYAIISAVLD